jgi:hypothetical protein
VVAAGALLGLAGAGTLIAGTTFGFFDAAGSQESNSFTAGTVTLTDNVSGACTVANLAPGDTAAPCTLGASYSGSLTAYLAVDVLVESQAGAGGTMLYNPSGSNGLTMAISDNQGTPVTYVVPSAPTSCPQGAPAGSTCFELDNELLGTSAYAGGATDTITTSVSLPAAAGNGYQGGGAQVVLTVHAVQAKDNSLSCTATPTAGHPCTASGGFAWS